MAGCRKTRSGAGAICRRRSSTCCGGSTSAWRARRPTPSGFSELGAPHVVTTGDLKLDGPAPPADRAKLAALQSAIGGRPVIAAASTHAGEETAMIDAHRRLRANFPGLLTLIAPRHPERGAGVAEIARAAGLKTAAALARRIARRDHRHLCRRHRRRARSRSIAWRRSFSSAARWSGTAGRIRSSPPSSAPPSCTARMCGISPKSMPRSTRRMAPSRSPTPASSPPASAPCWRSRQRAPASPTAARATVEGLSGALERTLQSLDPYLMQLRLRQRADHA